MSRLRIVSVPTSASCKEAIGSKSREGGGGKGLAVLDEEGTQAVERVFLDC